MLNDLNQFEPDNSNLPAPVTREQEQSNQAKSTVSSVDISLLFQEGVEQALLNSQPIMTVPIFNNPVPVDVNSSPNTGYLESIDKNLVLIHDHLKDNKPESVNLDKIENLLQGIQQSQAQNKQAAERSSELQEKQDKREEQQKVADSREDKKEQKQKNLDDKETKKYRKKMLDYEETRSKRDQKAEKSAASSSKSANGISTDQLATYARNPYSILSDALTSLKSKFKNGFPKRSKGGAFNIDFEDTSEEPEGTEEPLALEDNSKPALPPPDEETSAEDILEEQADTSEEQAEAQQEASEDDVEASEELADTLSEETEVVEGTLEDISDSIGDIAEALDTDLLDNTELLGDTGLLDNNDILALPPPDWLVRMNEGIDSSVLGLEDNRAMESLTPLTDPLIQSEQPFNFDDKAAITSELVSAGVPAFLAPMLSGAVSTFGPALMDSGLVSDFVPNPTDITAGANPTTPLDSLVVGEGEDESNFYKKSNEANALLTDTLEDPEDSDLVNALTADTKQEADKTDSSNLLGTILTAAILAVLAPHMDKIIGIVEQLIPIVQDVVDVVKDIWNKCLQPILVATSESIIKIINSLADFLTAIVKEATNMINVILPRITSIWEKILLAIEPHIANIVDKGAQFFEKALDLLNAVTDKLIEMVTEPKKFFKGIIDVFITSVEQLVDAFVGDLVHGFRMILPETLGGFDKKYKQGQLEIMEEEYQKRHNLDVQASEEMESSVVEAVEEGLAGTANIQAATVNVYAVSPDGAANTNESTSSSNTTVNNDNSQAQVVIYTANAAVVSRPGGDV